jgi:hypothetical protein
MSFGGVGRGGLIGVFVVAAIGPGARAMAAPADRAEASEDEALLRRGVELRRQGRDEEALKTFRSAFRLRATPRAQAQMGLAEQALGHWVDAEGDISAAIRSREDPWIARNMNVLLSARGKVLQHLGQLQVLGSPAGAAIHIDERDLGAMPMKAPVYVPLGEVVIFVSAPGYISLTRRSTIPSASEIVRETIALHEEPRTAARSSFEATGSDAPGWRSPAKARPAAPAVESASAGSDATSLARSSPPSSGHSSSLTVAAVVGGTGLLFLAGGIAAQVLSSSVSQQFNDVKDAPNPTMQCNQQLPDAGGGPCQGLLDSARMRKNLALVGYGVGGVAAAISLVVLVTMPAARSGNEAMAACAPTAGGGAGISCAFTFRL